MELKMLTNDSATEAAFGFSERRSVRRQSVVIGRARIAWRDGISHFWTSPARLIDISDRGARLMSGLPAGAGQAVWIGLEVLPCEWVRAIVKAVVPGPGEWSVHLAFREPCPIGLLEAATHAAPRRSPILVPSFSFERD
jgi:hypothetical protein